MLRLYLFSICPTSSRKNEEYVAGLSGASSKPPEQSMQNITQNFNRKGLCKNLEAQTWMPAVSQALTQWARALSSWTSQGQCKKIKRKLRNMNLIKPTNPNTHHELSQKLKRQLWATRQTTSIGWMCSAIFARQTFVRNAFAEQSFEALLSWKKLVLNAPGRQTSKHRTATQTSPKRLAGCLRNATSHVQTQDLECGVQFRTVSRFASFSTCADSAVA
jgi:hypothetical protein